ncbi:MAG: hypothetical protein EAX86_11145 [Candidatus Heimdallarchaeota archaeon]|nr:hypothetical protein [Candidatus Heimdallarchaeota archaeon]
MNNVHISQQNRFYLLAVDLLKGIAIFPMIFGHSIGWWDLSISKSYDTSGDFVIIIIWITGLLVFPCFLYLYGFNQVNSFLRKKLDISYSQNIRGNSIKRVAIFFLFASITLAIMALIKAPGKLLNYLLTWHLFHLFAFSTLFLLVLWELASWVEKKGSAYWSYIQIYTILLMLCFGIILLLFIYFHDYTIARESSRLFPVSLEIKTILENILLDVSSCGIIPWLSFPLAGGITASLLNLPSSSIKNTFQKSKVLLLTDSTFLIFGILSLRTERFVSAGLGYASTFPHVFISIGLIGWIFVVLILVLDISQKIPRINSYRLFYPILVVSKISLTVYLIHPVVGVFDPTLISSKPVLLLLVSIYSFFFIILAHFWQKRDFKYSLEWIVRKVTE